MFVDLSTLLIKYFSCLIAPKNMKQIIKTCMQFVAHIVGYCNLLLSQVMHSKQSCGKWTTHTRTTPQTHVPGIRKWSIALLDPSLACEFSISFYTMFNANSLNLCTRRLTRMKKSVAMLMRCKSISTGAEYLTPDSKIYCEKVKICRFSSGNWFFCTKIVEVTMARKRHNTVVHLQKKCTTLDLTAAQYFWLLDHNDWSRWFALSGSHVYAVPLTVVGFPKKKLNLDI
jgi:hypothetical protein